MKWFFQDFLNYRSVSLVILEHFRNSAFFEVGDDLLVNCMKKMRRIGGMDFTLMKSNPSGHLSLKVEQWYYPLLEVILMEAALPLDILSLEGQMFHTPTPQKLSGTPRLRV